MMVAFFYCDKQTRNQRPQKRLYSRALESMGDLLNIIGKLP